MRRFSVWLLLFVSASLGLAQAQPIGRWLFNGMSHSGKKVPLFILEFDGAASAGARLVATSAPFQLSISGVRASGDQVVIDLIADQRKLTLQGTFNGSSIVGKATGGALKDLAFFAEPTQLSELKQLQAPTPEDVEAYQTARATDDPKQRAGKLRDFVAKRPESPLKSNALLQIFVAVLEADGKDEELLQSAEEAIKSTSDPGTVMNGIAYALAEQKRLLDKAEQLARSAISLSAPESDVRANFTDTLGWILYQKNKLPEAADTLREAVRMNPRQADIALHLAQTLEKLDRPEDATEAYLTAYAGGGARTALSTARKLYEARHGSLDGFHELMDKQFAKLPPLFNAGHFEGEYSGPALVAELFTGSQCGPCQSADYGFDALIDHYPTKVLTVLEYHVPVPDLDPMTNQDALARARFYKLRSTPVAIFSGTQRHEGGGHRELAEVAFQEYRQVIEDQLKNQRTADVSLTVKRAGDVLHVTGHVSLPAFEQSGAGGKQLRLFVALVEKAVHYSGSNGVHIHRNVVRQLLGGAQGEQVTSADFNFEREAKLTEVENAQKAYLDSVAQEWGRQFSDAPTTLNRDQLAVAAFIQNPDSGEILGSAIAEPQ